MMVLIVSSHIGSLGGRAEMRCEALQDELTKDPGTLFFSGADFSTWTYLCSFKTSSGSENYRVGMYAWGGLSYVKQPNKRKKR
jgi:hypothetical protein